MSNISYNSKTKVYNDAVFACGPSGVFYYPILGGDDLYIGDLDNGSARTNIGSPKATEEMCEVALFNLISFENYRNPHKTGAYRLDSTKLKDCFSDAMFKVETGRMDVEGLKRFFALKYENDYLNKNLDNLIGKVISQKTKAKNVEPEL